MHRLIGMMLSVAALSIGASDRVAAQLPFGDVPDMQGDQMRYTGEVLRTLHDMMKDWRTAWVEGDDREIAKFYAENGSVVLPDRTRISGRDAIEQELRETLATVGPIQTGVTEFEVGGTLAFGMGWFKYDTEKSGVYEVVQGRQVIALRREGRRWRILSQVFIDDREAN